MAEINKICEDFRLAVWDLVFDPDEIGDLVIYEKHLEDCPKCAGAYEQVKAIADELKQVKLPEPPADLQDKIRNRLSAISRKPLSPHRFVKYATAASVLAAIFVLLLIFAPSQTLPEAVAEASRIHDKFVSGEVKVLTKMTSPDEFEILCKQIGAIPGGTIPKNVDVCELACCCDCKSVCNCPPEHCEVSKFTNKGAYLVFIKDAKPISLFVVKSFIKLPDYAKRSMEGMDCYVFPVNKLMVCAYAQNNVTYFWVSELGEEEIHNLIMETKKN